MPDIISAVQARAWYPAAALILLFATQFLRKSPWTAHIWKKIPEGARWLVPVAGGAVTGFVAAYQAGESLQDALLAALGGILTVSFPAMGANAALTDSPIPWNGGAGGKGG
jgi:hypothetical protein